MSPVYQPAFRISKQARAERQRAGRAAVVRYLRCPDGEYRCTSCGAKRGQPHLPHCAPPE
jgi:hypothetical protein